MARSKASSYDAVSYQQAQWSKAISYPGRIIILNHLHQHGPTPYHTLVKLLPISRTTTSQHLKILREAGIISLHEHYPHSFYSLEPGICKNYAKLIKPIIDTLVTDYPV